MTDVRIRRATEADIDAIVELVYELADYQRAREHCELTADDLRASLFGDRPALFGHVAESDGAVVGFALWFLIFSTWQGRHGIHLEDLYVRPEHRGSGMGKALLAALAEECVRCGYGRLEWSVLHWNEPAIGFYRSLGASPVDEWAVYRLSGDALAALGSTD